MSELFSGIQLRSAAPPEWLAAVMADFDSFLLDHAAAERKASAMALKFVVRYPDRDELMEPMILLAREELAHFHRVYRLMAERGLKFGPDRKDAYIKAMLGQLRHGRQEEFLDRLLLAGLIELRGCERFGLVADALEPGELKVFYNDITKSEERHHELFFDLALNWFEQPTIEARLDELMDFEAKAAAAVPARAALH